MFSHIMVGASDINESKVFYDAVLGALGHNKGVIDEKGRCCYSTKLGMFLVSKPIDGKSVSHGNGSTIGFVAESAEMADAWHDAGLAAGGTAIEEPPGPRQSGEGLIYLAYLRDPAGNKVCALHHLA
ncbi:MAG: VOC family protein [Halioglobus sp.]|nr:VOC family protein [Halioglobus sp.]